MTNQIALTAAPAWGPVRVSTYAAHRVARWRYELLDARGVSLGTLRGCRGGKFRYNVNATIRGAGEVTYTGPEIDWMKHRIRVWYGFEARGHSEEWAVGTFIPTTPGRTHTQAGAGTVSLKLYDLMYRLDVQRTASNPWVCRKGESIIGAVRRLLDYLEVPHQIEDSPVVAATEMAWPAGTKCLTLANELLDAAGFFACWADPMGVIRSGPYRPPSARGTRYAFRPDDPDAITTHPSFYVEADAFDTPSHVVLVAESDDPDAPPMTAEATDFTSEFSQAARNIRVTHFEDGVPAATLEILQAKARKRLEEVQRVGEKVDFHVLPLPMDGNDVVRFSNPRAGVDMTVTVEEFEVAQGRPEMDVTGRKVRA